MLKWLLHSKLQKILPRLRYENLSDVEENKKKVRPDLATELFHLPVIRFKELARQLQIYRQ